VEEVEVDIALLDRILDIAVGDIVGIQIALEDHTSHPFHLESRFYVHSSMGISLVALTVLRPSTSHCSLL